LDVDFVLTVREAADASVEIEEAYSRAATQAAALRAVVEEEAEETVVEGVEEGEAGVE
jgi:hypothetical protein